MKNLKNATTEAAMILSHNLKGVCQMKLKIMTNWLHGEVLL